MDIGAANEALKKMFWQPSYRFPKYRNGPQCSSQPIEIPTLDYAEATRHGCADYGTKHMRWYRVQARDGALREYWGYADGCKEGAVWLTDAGWLWEPDCPPWKEEAPCWDMWDGFWKADAYYWAWESGGKNG